MPSRKHRYWVLLVVFIGLLGLVYWAYSGLPSSAAPTAVTGHASGAKPAAGASGGTAGGFSLSVETVKVATSNFALDATAVGSLRPNESVVLRPETAGRISSINFKDGSAVGKGGLLVELDAATQSAEQMIRRKRISVWRRLT